MTSADIILEGARVHSLVPGDDGSDSRSIAIADGRVLGVGDRAQIIEAFAGSHTRTDDLSGATVTPGLIDAHLHPIQGVELTQGVDLGGMLDFREILESLRQEAGRVRRETSDGWVRAWNLDYAALDGAAMSAALIDDAVDGLPALLFFFDFHTALASTEGLRRGGITGARARGSIGLSAIRGGDIVGEHDVIFAADGERIILRHIATDRAIFARGALKAAIWGQSQKPGRYDMMDVLGL